MRQPPRGTTHLQHAGGHGPVAGLVHEADDEGEDGDERLADAVAEEVVGQGRAEQGLDEGRQVGADEPLPGLVQLQLARRVLLAQVVDLQGHR